MVRTFGRDKIKVETEGENPDNVATELTQQEINEGILYLLLTLQDKLRTLGVKSSGTNRLLVDLGSGSLASVTTLSTLTNANNLINIAGIGGWVPIKSASVANFNNFINTL